MDHKVKSSMQCENQFSDVLINDKCTCTRPCIPVQVNMRGHEKIYDVNVTFANQCQGNL